MSKTGRVRGLRVTVLYLALGAIALAQSDQDGDLKKEKTLSVHASGPFDVKITPQTLPDQETAAGLGRMSLDKQYHGDLEATAKGAMLTADTAMKESGVYVAVERVTGTLQGRSGTFAMHHTGVMTRDTPALKITVVPDSGTGQLVGLAGTMNIRIDNGKHFYEFDYTLPDSK